MSREQMPFPEQHANWKAPEAVSPPSLPGGELHTRPMQRLDGTWEDGYGERLSPEEARIAVDGEYASAFWKDQPSGMLEIMRGIIEKAGEKGKIVHFTGPHGFEEKDREKLSAYRILAEEMGYESGPFRLDPKTHTATAEIKRKGTILSE